ncbi:MAG: radical SAM protein [Candidatus Bathyarchaeota archaeon]|nr:radical SAM protein [Candidatus Bathyarchaeota archaeon]
MKFAFVQVTTRCNAKCTDRCNIWASSPYDMPIEELKFTIDVLSRNNFSVVYFTGGETSLYPHIVDACIYGKQKGMVTSLTTNGTISSQTIRQLRGSLDVLSISVDHYNEEIWDQTKHVAGISRKAKDAIKTAKEAGLKTYAITFLNPNWSVDNVEKTLHYINDELGVSFALSYPYSASNGGTYRVDSKLSNLGNQDAAANLRGMVAKILELKLQGADVATVTGYMRDVLRAHDGIPMKYPCNAGKSSFVIDCNLNVFPCYRRPKLFNLKECQTLAPLDFDSSVCDNRFCLINCFKEGSMASRQTCLRAVKEELFSNPKFYLKLLKR